MARKNFLWGALSLIAVVTVTLIHSTGGYQVTDAAASEEKPKAAGRTTVQRTTSPEFKQAGVCARCHVVSVLEWGISGHVAAETDCQSCHGPSRGHVANERNEVKPDRLPRGAAIAAQVCSECHKTGCPESLQVQNCQKCHHVHALINPTEPPKGKDTRLDKLMARWQRFEQRVVAGEQHVKQRDWQAARAEFQAALEMIPGNHRAQQRLEMCVRRLNPHLAGFECVGDRLDAETGLPNEVRVVELGTRMILVPPGEFDMGSDAWSNSRPVHTVQVDAFYLGNHEVTQGLWQTIMGENPSAHQGKDIAGAERLPVERVSWDDCQQFLRRINERVAGDGFRLPTEAEWEYACRAGRPESPFPAETPDSIEILRSVAWYRQTSLLNADSHTASVPIDAFATRRVGTRQPNPWGFYDMQGNVAEWCSSLFRPYLYYAGDGRESLSMKGMRVLRGGGFADTAASLHPAARHAERPHRRLRWNGLRLARTVPSLGVANKRTQRRPNGLGRRIDDPERESVGSSDL